MPRVPTALEQQRPVSAGQRSALLRADRSLGSRGEARALGRLSDSLLVSSGQLQRDARKIQENEDTALVMSADNAASIGIREALSGDDGLLRKRGREARERYTDLPDALAKLREQSGQGLTTPRQRFLFNQQFDRRAARALDTGSNHAFREMERYLDEEAQATIANAIDDAASDPNNPRTIAEAQERLESAVLVRSQGQSQEVIDRRLEEARTDLHVGVVQRLVNDSPGRARGYFNAVKDEMTGKAQAQVERMIDAESRVYAAAGAANNILARHGDDKASALEAVAEIGDPRIQSEARSRVRAHFEVQEIRDKERDEATIVEAYRFVENGGDPNSLPADIRMGLIEADPNIMDGLRLYYSRLTKKAPLVTDSETYLELSEMSDEDFAQENLMRHRHKLSDNDFRRLSDRQNRIRNRKVDAPDDPGTLTQQLSAVEKALGLRGRKQGQFRRVTMDVIADEAERLGRELTFKERQAVIDAFTTEIVVRESSFFNADLGARLTPYRLESASEIPPSELQVITNVLRSEAGREPTEAEIIDLYQSMLVRRAIQGEPLFTPPPAPGQ